MYLPRQTSTQRWTTYIDRAFVDSIYLKDQLNCHLRGVEATEFCEFLQDLTISVQTSLLLLLLLSGMSITSYNSSGKTTTTTAATHFCPFVRWILFRNLFRRVDIRRDYLTFVVVTSHTFYSAIAISLISSSYTIPLSIKTLFFLLHTV